MYNRYNKCILISLIAERNFDTVVSHSDCLRFMQW